MHKMQMYDQDHRDKLMKACRDEILPADPLCVMKCQNLIYAIDAVQDAMAPTVEDYNEIDVPKPKERGEDQ